MKAGLDTFGGRKYVMCMLVIIICAGLLIGGYITAVIFRDIILGIPGVYILGNVSQKVWGKTEAPAT